MVGDEERRVGITRVHLEEDTAKHSDRSGSDGPYSLIDVNRGGVPLMEIVSEPDIRSADEAREYLRALRSILRWVGASTGSMEAGAFRCDANVSVRPAGSTTFGTKVEVKNMNSFRAVHSALRFEIERQIKANESGETIVQETRGWVEQRGVTVSQRSKEFAHDYRYFPEPDLPPLRPKQSWVAEIRTALPELPAARRARYQAEHGLSAYDAGLLTAERELADFFDRVIALGASAKTAANWMNGDLRRLLADTTFEAAKVTPESFVELLGLLDKGELNRSQGQQVLETLFREGGAAGEVAKARGLTQVSDEGVLVQAVRDAIAANPKVVEDYRSGKKQAAGFLVGQVMKATRGQANPGKVNELLARELEA
jgi:aspartyl-tRNA(Asn)/glutamyl-tRNA(Gln) amidotransferase subunit B